MPGFSVRRFVFGPPFPWMIGEGIPPVRREISDEIAANAILKAAADAHMLQNAGIVVEAEQQRANSRALPVLVPSKTANDTIAIALVLHFEHNALVGFIRFRNRLRYDAVKTRALKASKPIRSNGEVSRCRRQMDRRLCG